MADTHRWAPGVEEDVNVGLFDLPRHSYVAATTRG